MKRFLTLLVLATLFYATNASAESRHSLHWSDTTAFRYNPLGAVTAGTLDYRLRMYDTGATIFNNYISLAAKPIISPAYARLGAQLEIVPMAMLALSVRYEYIQYFGNFDFFQSFPDQTHEMWEDDIEANAEAGENYAATGTQLSFSGLLQAKVGKIAIRNRTTVFQNTYDVPADHDVFYDAFLDIALPTDGWGMTNELDALYVNRALVAGVRHTFTKGFLDEIAGAPASADHRVGPLILYEIYRNKDAGLSSIKLLSLIQWHIVHRYRAGQASSIAIPYTGVGAIFAGQIF